LHKIKWIIPPTIAVAIIYGLVLIVTSFGMRFYTHSVPVLHEVAGVFVGTSRWEQGTAFIGDDESVTRAIALHHYILDNQNEVNQAFWRSFGGGNEGDEYLFFAYRLTDGSMLYRRYAVTADFIARSGAEHFINFNFNFTPPPPSQAEAPQEDLIEPPEYEAENLPPYEPPPAPVALYPDMIDFIRLRFVGLPGNEEFTISEPSQVELLIGALYRDHDADLLRQQEYGDTLDYMVEVYIEIREVYREYFSNVSFSLVQMDYTIALIQMYAEQGIDA